MKYLAMTALVLATGVEAQTVIFEDGTQYEVPEGYQLFVSAEPVMELVPIPPLVSGATPPPTPTPTPTPVEPTAPAVGSQEWCDEYEPSDSFDWNASYYVRYCEGG